MSKKQQIVDRRYGSVLTESYKPASNYEGPVIGTFSTKGMAAENTVSQNETFYSTQLWASQNALGKGGKFIDENGKLKPSTLYGSADHPIDEDVNKMLPLIKESAIVWKDIKRNDDGTYDGTADILNTPNGKVIKVLLDYVKENGGGDVLGVSSRGLGESRRVNEGYSEIIPESYELLAFDFVFNPSFSNQASLVESKRFNQQPITEAIRKLADDDKDHASFYQEYAEILEEEVDSVNTKEIQNEVSETNTKALKDFIKSLKVEINKLNNALFELDMMEDDEFRDKYPNKKKETVAKKLSKEKKDLEKLLAYNLELTKDSIKEAASREKLLESYIEDHKKQIKELYDIGKDFVKNKSRVTLYGGSVDTHIVRLKELVNSLPVNEKVSGIDMDKVCELHSEMAEGDPTMKKESKDIKKSVQEASDLDDVMNDLEDNLEDFEDDDVEVDNEEIADEVEDEESDEVEDDEAEEDEAEEVEIKDPELKLIFDKLSEVMKELNDIRMMVEPVEDFNFEEDLADEEGLVDDEEVLADIEDLDLEVEDDEEVEDEEIDLSELSDEELEALIAEEEEYLKANA